MEFFKFVVTIAQPQGPTNKEYVGNYEVLESGVLEIRTGESDSEVEYLSPIGWFWVGRP